MSTGWPKIQRLIDKPTTRLTCIWSSPGMAHPAFGATAGDPPSRATAQSSTTIRCASLLPGGRCKPPVHTLKHKLCSAEADCTVVPQTAPSHPRACNLAWHVGDVTPFTARRRCAQASPPAEAPGLARPARASMPNGWHGHAGDFLSSYPAAERRAGGT